MFECGKNYKLTIINQEHFGRGIAKYNDVPIFVHGALPKEFVSVKITSVNKKYCTGIATKIITPSKHRVDAPCKYYNECGGCQIMHQEYSENLVFKRRIVMDALYKFGGFDIKNIKLNNIVASPTIFNYRNKITLHVYNNMIGYYKKGSRELVDIDKCLIVDNVINDVIDIIRNHLKNIKEVIIRYGKYTDQLMIIFKVIDDLSIELFDELGKHIKSLTSVYVIKDGIKKNVCGEELICEKLLGKTFQILPDSFFQVNTLQAENMFSKVKTYINKDDENILDLYCGSGVISILISGGNRKIIGVDIVEESIINAKENAKINKCKNLCFIKDDVVNVLPIILKTKKHIDVLIVDPPRNGIDKKSIEFILEIKPKKIIYISCNPITLARDLKILNNIYNLEEVTPYDMFPMTYHVECVSVLSRKAQ